jgi:transposase-like protein
MGNTTIYAAYRYPSQIISHAVWFYHRFILSFRDIEELLAARGITASYETIRNGCQKLGQQYCKLLKNYRVLGAGAFVEWVRVSCVQNLEAVVILALYSSHLDNLTTST